MVGGLIDGLRRGFDCTVARNMLEGEGAGEGAGGLRPACVELGVSKGLIICVEIISWC